MLNIQGKITKCSFPPNYFVKIKTSVGDAAAAALHPGVFHRQRRLWPRCQTRQMHGWGRGLSLETLTLDTWMFVERQVPKELRGVIAPYQISSSFGTALEIWLFLAYACNFSACPLRTVPKARGSPQLPLILQTSSTIWGRGKVLPHLNAWAHLIFCTFEGKHLILFQTPILQLKRTSIFNAESDCQQRTQ